jgi:hypothetical protein
VLREDPAAFPFGWFERRADAADISSSALRDFSSSVRRSIRYVSVLTIPDLQQFGNTPGPRYQHVTSVAALLYNDRLSIAWDIIKKYVFVATLEQFHFRAI